MAGRPWRAFALLGSLAAAVPATAEAQAGATGAAAMAAAQADAAPLRDGPAGPVSDDPCAPVRRISPEFGAAFAALPPADDELAEPAGELGSGGAEWPRASRPAAWRRPWQPPAAAHAGPPAPPFLASKLLPVGRTGFDREWRRVRDVIVSRACAARLLGRTPPPSLAMLQAVSGWVNRRVRYVEDVGGDRWADAPTTLRYAAGDCEDIAIAKMQLLAALGIPEQSMYLSLVRDLLRRRDHAVLIVRLDNGPWLLDDATERVIDAASAHDYRPVMSFSGSRKWLHGQERASALPILRSR